MKKRKFLVSLIAGILAFVLVLGLILSILPASVSAKSSEEIQEEIDALEEQHGELEDKLLELEKEQNSNWSSIEEMVEQKNNLDQQINLLNEEIENINEQIRSYSLLIAENQAELDEAEAVLAELNEKNQERIRAMEEMGEISYWSVIFHARSFTDLIDRMNMMQEIQEADQRRLAELDQAAKAVAQAREELDAQKEGLEQTRQELAASQTVLDTKRSQADGILTQLNAQQRDLLELEEEYLAQEAELSSQIAEAEAEYNKAKEAEEAARKAAEEAARKAAEEAARKAAEEAAKKNQQTSHVGSSGWYVPCAYKSLTSAYGYRTHPITGKYSFHNGVDLANDEGTNIYAAKTGTVTTATYNGVYGYYVVINHGDGYSTLYAHMTKYTVSVGDVVAGGQLIGYMGSTGWSTGPHLHYTVYYNGATVNPVNFL